MSKNKLRKFLSENLIYISAFIISFLVLCFFTFRLFRENETINQLNVQISQLKQQITAKKTQLKDIKDSYIKELENIKMIQFYSSLGIFTEKPESFGRNIFSFADKLGIEMENFNLKLKDNFILVKFSVSGKEDKILTFLTGIIKKYPITLESLNLNKPKAKLKLEISFKIATGSLPATLEGAIR